MGLKYDKLFKTVDPLDNESVTFLVEYIDGRDKQVVLIQSLKGEYNSTEEFNEATDRFYNYLQRIVDGVHVDNPMKAWNTNRYKSLSLPMSDTHQLLDALTETLRAAQGS